MLGVEKKTVAKLQDEKTLKKIYKLDEHIYASSAGLAADARILMNKARVECQSYRLAMEDPITVELIARYVSGVQQVCKRFVETNFFVRNTLKKEVRGHLELLLCLLELMIRSPNCT